MGLNILSLGAGIQTTTLALMAARGEIPRPDFAIFADTGWETVETYQHLDWLEAQLNYKLVRVANGNIKDTIATGQFDPIPWFTTTGIGQRQCTNQYKLKPIRRYIRQALGSARKAQASVWLGITIDEAHRVKPAREGYISHRWPLIELGMSRADCHAKLARWGIRAPKSACCGCPYLADREWLHRRTGPDWAETVAISHKLADTGQYMHRSRKPIDQIDLSRWDQADLFGDECEGICAT